MVINLMLPAGIALLAYAIHASRLIPTWEMATASPPILFLVCGALALGELVAAFILKRQFFSQQRVAPIRHDPAAIDQWLLKSSIIIYALGASPMIYGSILYILSGDLRQLAFFGIITMLSYRLFHPTTDQLEEILKAPESAA
ncbi:MAG: hypothetical protein GF341_10320 [candidate division Zixibacteria bacterium]|nr:hypothetical protein [candidate division Zixibacteria bacterium]